MGTVAALWYAGWLAAAAMAPAERLIVVTKPTVVAFFAPVSEADLDRDLDTNEALADFQHYASRVEPALHTMGAAFHVVYARSFQVRDGTRLRTFRPPGAGVGYYLVAPGKRPRVEEGVMTDEDLVAVAREHFGQESPVWSWFAACGGPSMAVEVQFDKKTVHKVTVPLCRAPRSASSQGQARRIEFAFEPGRVIRWRGYKDTAYRSRAGESLEVTLWQAGADPDAVTIGVTVMTPKTILLNTVHIAHPHRRDASTLAPGLTVETYAVAR